ncbi:MFS transporter [Paraburkholderia hayleyella]|uniref:MFS transporter n=1 Tax=Paraburkholderia hayleyella TaxID=2152889 RepID=UPI001292622B|nr:MFS transporter [Paraburkholderia hayleyella]
MTSQADGLHAATLGRINRRLLPFLMLLYLVAYIDRSNISVAALQMNVDLGLTVQMYGLGAGLFYVTYILFEVPGNLVLARVGARRWIARIMLTWGVIAAGMAFIQTPTQFYVMRLLLGAAEAGFTPGIIYYIACWYPSSDRARAMSFFYIGAALASLIGLPLSGVLLELHGGLGFAGWRWLFFLEGIPAVLLGWVVLRRLPERPDDAPWLAPAQRAWLNRALSAETPRHEAARRTEAGFAAELSALKTAFGSRTVWALAALWLLQAFGTIGITLFLPLLVKNLSGQSNFIVASLSALPFLLACVLMYANGHHSDLTGERTLHLGIPLIGSGLLLASCLYASHVPTRYAMLVLAIGLNWAVTPVFWALTTEFVSGMTAAASIALINAVANLAGLALPPAMGWIKDTTHSYDPALLLIAAALMLGGMLGLRIASRSQLLRPVSRHV